MSLVVPGMSVTIEISRLANKFIKLDLPEFGGPVITIFAPS